MNNVHVTELPNRIRILTISTPNLHSASVGVFVHSGSRNETAEMNGISHFLEHMAFKGTTTRNAQAINLDAERLGMEVNAFTSREMTGYHMSGLGKHTEPMLRMLGDIVCHSTFPEAEIEREREVIQQEALEYDESPDDVVSTLLDEAVFGDQPMGRPVIGTKENIARFTRDDLIARVASQYTGSNIIVAAVGAIDARAIEKLTEELFGHLPAGSVHGVTTPVYVGGVRARKINTVSQVFANLAFPVANLKDGEHAQELAAILFGGGTSSPLYDQVRERMGLAYHVGSGCDVGDRHGSFMIQAVTTPNHLNDFFKATGDLLRGHAQRIDPIDLDRAKNQLSVHLVSSAERPFRALQRSVDQLFSRGRIVDVSETIERVQAISEDEVKLVFKGMLRHKPAVALVGKGATKAACKTFLDQPLHRVSSVKPF